MQIKAENFALLGNLIKNAKNILIFVGENPSVDSLAAAIFLEENFSDENRKIKIIAKGNIPETLNKFTEKISDRAVTKKLVVSFNWKDLGVEKVSYNLEGENFNFIITPRSRKIDSDKVKISYQGQEEDLIVVLGIYSLSELEYFSNESETKPIINIDKGNKNELFGTLNFVNSKADSISAVVATIFEKANLPAKSSSGEVLVLGIKSATENFNNVSDPATFEAAAFCTRLKEKTQMETNFQPKEDPKKETKVPEDWLAPKVIHSKEIHN